MKPSRWTFSILFSLLAALSLSFNHMQPRSNSCIYWVAPAPLGNDFYPGTRGQPWASLEHAAAAVPDTGCKVYFEDGTYTGGSRIKRSFTAFTWFKAIHPYGVILENSGPALSISGGRNIGMEGFVFQHSGPGASPLVVQVERGPDRWSEYIILRDNIFRNSYNDDLLKIYDGARFVTVEGNLFYNQGDGEQHMDVNSVTDVNIQDNIFFNDFAASGRPVRNDTKHYIVIKDSNGDEDGLTGSERVTVQRNIFMNWEGGPGEAFVQVGNDGKPYIEAKDVTIQNNLFLGNSSIPMMAPFGVSGASGVSFLNNTISGDLPSRAFAARIIIKDQNPKNQNILMCNNIWSDPTGTMGSPGKGQPGNFADGNPADSVNLVLSHNLYWNGKQQIPDGKLLSPLKDDLNRTVVNPQLQQDFDKLIPPVWNGTAFPDGSTRIQEEFLRLVEDYGTPSSYSSALGTAYPGCAPRDDILRKVRGLFPSFGAVQGVVR